MSKQSKKPSGSKRKKRANPKVGLIPKLPLSIRPLRTGGAHHGKVPNRPKNLAATVLKTLAASGISCPLFEKEVQRIVISVIQSFHPNRVITLDKEFEADLGIDPQTRRIYFEPIQRRMRDQGCDVAGLSPPDMMACELVQDVADKFWAARQ